MKGKTLITPEPAASGKTSSKGSALVDTRSLRIRARGTTGEVTLVDDFNLRIDAGERVALVGESGSGKSVTARAMMRLDSNVALSGSIRMGDQEILDLDESALTGIRGTRIGMVFQDPMSALNPLQTIGAQIAEPLRRRGTSRKAAMTQAMNMLEELGVARARERLRAYPHEFSGGMRQRVVLAMALIGEPQLLIADEPTTALDVRVQEQVFRLLDEVCRRRGLGVLLISHDLGVVAGFADRVAVMYAGRKIEEQPIVDLFARPRHPYTAGLLAAVPRMDRADVPLEPIPGTPPSPTLRPTGCAFHPRCPVRIEVCDQQVPADRRLDTGGMAACHLIKEADQS